MHIFSIKRNKKFDPPPKKSMSLPTPLSVGKLYYAKKYYPRIYQTEIIARYWTEHCYTIIVRNIGEEREIGRVGENREKEKERKREREWEKKRARRKK